MPWHRQAKKDAVSCEKLRGVANRHRSGDIRMGEPNPSQGGLLLPESIGKGERTQGSEPSQYLEEKKTSVISQVAASERERAQTGRSAEGASRAVEGVERKILEAGGVSGELGVVGPQQ
jgi:hypothetical protein